MEPPFDNPGRPSEKPTQPNETTLESLLGNDERTRKPIYDSDTQLRQRDLYDRLVKEWELTEKLESNRCKRANYRIILVAALAGAAVPMFLASLMFTGVIRSTDPQKSQSFTASVGIVTSILGFLAGYSAP
jgi:hypothetical protein